MLHLGTIALSALFVVCSAAAPASLFKKKSSEPLPAAYEQTEALNAEWETVDISYTSKTLAKSHSLALIYPDYNFSPAVGSCGSIAGGNVIGFYDRFDENLIPNHVSGTVFGNTYIYNMEDTATDQLITTLYEYMGTEHVGTTEDEFIDGMTRYCTEKGKKISFTSCMSLKSFNFTSAQQKMESNQPIVLFLSGYNATILTSEDDNNDRIQYYVSDGNHIMIGFGYKIYNYSTSSGTITYNYIDVSTGLSGITRTLFDISYKTKINDALAVNIY